MDQVILDAAASLGSLDALWIYALGFAVIVVCGIGLPLPEDVSLITMGYMTYLPMADGSQRPHASVLLAILAGFSAIMIGDWTMFTMGKRLGRRLLGRWPFSRFLKPERIASAEQWIEKQGPKVLFAARFMPGIRSVVFFTAGMLRTPYPRFVLWDGLAAVLSVPAFVLVGYIFGNQLEWAIGQARKAEHGVLGLLIAFFAFFALKSWWSRRREKQRDEAAKLAAAKSTEEPSGSA